MRFAAKGKALEKEAKDRAQKVFAAKLKEQLSVVVQKTRLDEKRKNDRILERATRENEAYRRQLERLTADERGTLGEAEIRRTLLAEFPGDHITLLAKTRNAADIRHEVREQGRACGVIIYEVKNVAKWSGSYVKQLRRSLGVVGASLGVLVSTAFPGRHKHLATEKDVFIVHPSIVGSLVRVLREIIIARASTTGGRVDRERRADQLLLFVRGEEFVRSMMALAERAADLANLQAKERRQHDQVWEAQTELYRSIERNHAAIESRVTHISSGKALALHGEGPVRPAN
jgi:hypothetical protein